MTLQTRISIRLFDKFKVTVPPGLRWNQDRINGKRALSISDPEKTFVISFEEGVQMKDMLPAEKGESPTISFQSCNDNGYIHLRRKFEGEITHAYFHFELEDKNFCTMYLPGRMDVSEEYNWTDGIEPALTAVLENISLIEG